MGLNHPIASFAHLLECHHRTNYRQARNVRQLVPKPSTGVPSVSVLHRPGRTTLQQRCRIHYSFLKSCSELH